MKRAMLLAAVLPLCAGCGRAQAEFWKDKFIKEVNYHYQSQQIKNAEIAAREMEIENNKVFIGILTDRINTLDKELEEARRKPAARPTGGGPSKRIDAKVTAVANEVHLVVLSVGEDGGLRVGDEFWILRGKERIGRAMVDHVGPKWAAAKVSDGTRDPCVGDDVSNADLIKEK